MRHWKIILSLMAIFIVGVISGGVLTLAITKRVIAKRTAVANWGPPAAPFYLKHYKEELALTPAQVEKLKPAFARLATNVRDSRSNMLAEVRVALRQLNEELVRELTPEQQARFEKMKERNRARLKDQSNGPLPPAGRRPQKLE